MFCTHALDARAKKCAGGRDLTEFEPALNRGFINMGCMHGLLHIVSRVYRTLRQPFFSSSFFLSLFFFSFYLFNNCTHPLVLDGGRGGGPAILKVCDRFAGAPPPHTHTHTPFPQGGF